MPPAALIATGDPTTLDDLLRLAAAAGAEAEVAADAARAVPVWHRSPLVLCGADLADELAPVAPRRPGVVLVAATGRDEVYRTALAVGAQDVAVLPDDETWLVDALATAAEPVAGLGVAVCVTGGCGGAGASVLAAGLGLAAVRRGLSSLLVDGDPFGGGLDIVLGAEETDGTRWPELAERRGRLSAAFLRAALPAVHDLAVLSWGRDDAPVRTATPEAMVSVLDAATRGFDLVVVDLPRPVGPAGETALRTADTTFLVVPAELRAAVAADRMAATLRRATTEIRLVVRGAVKGGLTSTVIAESLRLPLAAELPDDRRLATALDNGDLVRASRRGPFARLCDDLVSSLLAPSDREEVR